MPEAESLFQDDTLILLEIEDANKVVHISISKGIDFSGGLMKFISDSIIDINYEHPSAVNLFTKIIQKYNNIQSIKLNLLENLSQLEPASKNELKSFITSNEKAINDCILNLLAKPLKDNKFLSSEKDVTFIRNLFSFYKGVSQQIIYKLK